MKDQHWLKKKKKILNPAWASLLRNVPAALGTNMASYSMRAEQFGLSFVHCTVGNMGLF